MTIRRRESRTRARADGSPAPRRRDSARRRCAKSAIGVVSQPGGAPVGGIGVSGDGVDQDEIVAFAGAAGFEPGPGVAKLGF